MTTDLWYLACTAVLTAALWIPYIVCQVMTNGFLADYQVGSLSRLTPRSLLGAFLVCW
jgi:hypothetical protein